ncbi:hypothetical protein [Candidatus Poriferisodalis sp.]|uniref:hypothetical protein n=1 Tax=Candidatus Poriferisodalis sp. TaxID=3101277 RepID=UPI003B0235D7
MSDTFDPQALIERFAERAEAVRKRNLPAVGGEERRLFIEQAERDFMDYAMLGDATATLEDGILTLRIDLRPADS